MTNLSLLVALVFNSCDYFVSHEINYIQLIFATFENHEVKVIPSLISTSRKSSSKGAYSAIMLIVFHLFTIYTFVLPNMNALSNVGIILCVLHVIDQEFLTIFLKKVSMEESHLFGFQCAVLKVK